MSDRIKSLIDSGTGVYCISKKEAGEIHKYQITFKGLLSIYLPDAVMNELFSAIELSCRRSGWGIAINEENRLDFVPMVKVEESK
jgi:hypothetical protein